MTKSTDKELISRRLFEIAVALCFFTILIYEFLTPMLMDDMSYMSEVKTAGSVFDLFSQEKRQYLGWTGRSVAHIMLRLLMYLDLHLLGGGRVIFNFVSAAAFTLLSLLIYANVEKKKKHDIITYLLILTLLWIFAVSFAETILWETGACNYLLTTTIIMSFMTIFRKSMEKEVEGKAVEGAGLIRRSVLMLLFGILAGWCNENTSGGCLVFILFLTCLYSIRRKKIRPWMLSGIAGNIIGLGIMVLAPGNAARAQNREELHSGIVGLGARFLALTDMVRSEFFILLCILIVLVVYICLQSDKKQNLLDVTAFAVLSAITVYSLVLTATPQKRAIFGAGIFLIIAVVQAFQELEAGSVSARTLRISAVFILCLYMFFTYIAEGASLARIYREEKERYEYLEEVAATGAEDAEAPMLRPQFESRYSAAYDCDITDDWTYWTNMMMANYYGFKTLLGVDRDEWTGY